MRRLLVLSLLLTCACSSEDEPEPVLPQSLPFEVTRADKGTALTAAEITSFTKRVTGFWKQVDYFTWALSISHGMHADTGMPDYMVWWQDIMAVKEGDLVTFTSTSGGAHNVFIPTSKLLATAAAGYLATGDPEMGRMVEQYAKGLTASCKGMVYDENDPLPYLMSRNIVTHNHAYTLPDGRKKAVDYTRWYNTYETWNAQRLHYPNNPFWGDIYVTNMRSKDDVPHIYLAAVWLRYVAEYGKDEQVRAAAKESYEYVQGFTKDIVESGYHIRTKDADGNAYIPEEDLASFVKYESLVENGECNSKLSTALLAYDENKGNDCGRGDITEYEGIATAIHYFNYAIIRYFHVAAALSSLVSRDNERAERLVKGLAFRVERYMDPRSDEPGRGDGTWEVDIAVLALRSAAAGMPLTSEEARFIHQYWIQAIEKYEAWPNWKLWELPDGIYQRRDGYQPHNGGDNVRIEEIGLFLEYCYSPFRNPAGRAVIDCEVVTDPSRWGQ